MAPDVDSLNVGVAVGVTLYDVTRARQLAAVAESRPT
jgi:tRNA G18 (ribose-2'-O)-methylase SpoU